MTIFDEVKELVDVPTAARHYGIELNRSNMTLCPFHNEKTPSCKMYERNFHCFGNGSPRALYDKSKGFSRRMIILTTLNPPENRRNDPNICDKFIAEKEQIFCWMFDGLRRLIDNNFHFTISEKARLNVKETVEDSCNIIEFLSDTDRIIRGENLSVSSHELYTCYYSWCEDNALLAMKSQSFSAWLKENAETANVNFSYHVKYNGHRVRGFTGIAVKHSTTPF